MPKKNIYIRKEDMPIFDKAMEKLGEEETIGEIIIRALKEQLDNLPEVKEEVLLFQLIKHLGFYALNEVINYRLQNYSEIVVKETEMEALAAYVANPDHFKPNLDELPWWANEYLWNGSNYILDSYEDITGPDWFEEAKKLILEGKKIIEEAEKERVDNDNYEES